MANRFLEIYIIKPKADTTNLVTNPSVETATTGYTAVGASSSIARSATYQRRGTYCLDITPTSSAISGVYFGTVSLSSGTTYVFSCDVLDVNGQTFNLYIQAADGTPTSSSTTWTGDGYWKRKSISWACTSTETYRLYLTRDSIASTTHFYTDGWQCESGTESTYFDGDSVGFNRFRQDYGWTGTAHASTSWRSGKTRTGGTMLRIQDYAKIVGAVGLGMPPVVNNVLEAASGNYYQSTKAQSRPITLILDFRSTSGLSTIASNRQALIDAIKPDNVPTDEPLVLRFAWVDSSGNPAGDVATLNCSYDGGLEYDTGDPDFVQVHNQAAVTFTAHDPMFKVDGTTGADLTVGTSVSNAAYLLYRTAAGQWTSAGVVNNYIKDIRQSPNGMIYVTGQFTSIGGVSANRIAYWDGTAWNAMGSGLDSYGNSIVIAPDGYPYVGGNFTTANGVTVNYVAKWTGTTFSAMGATGTNGQVYGLNWDTSGNLLVCGAFSTAGGVTVNGVAKWSGTTWTAMGSGVTIPGGAGGRVSCIVSQSKKYIWCCTANDVSYAAGAVYRWDGSTWTDMAAGGTYYYAMILGRDGRIYVGGSLYPSSTQYLFMRVFQGKEWKTLLSSTTEPGYIARFALSKKGIYLGGSFATLNDITYNSCALEYKYGNFRPVDVNIDYTAGYISAFCETSDGQLWVGGTWTTTPIVNPGITTSNNGSSLGYPRIRLIGPGTFWYLKNYNTGQMIYFNGLTLQSGETAILDMRPGHVGFTSNWRGNLLGYIMPGSDLTFEILSGSNYISCYITGSDANTKALMAYQGQYWDISGAAR